MIIIQQLSIPFSQPQPQLPKLPNPFSPQPQNNKIKINPVICLDFNKPLTLQINIVNGEANNDVD